MKRLPLEIPRDKIAAFCRKHHIRKLSFFGSILRDDFDNRSYIDILVEFEPGHIPGLAFFGPRFHAVRSPDICYPAGKGRSVLVLGIKNLGREEHAQAGAVVDLREDRAYDYPSQAAMTKE